MKLKKSLFGIALTTIGLGALVSCSNELSDPNRIDNGTVSLKLVKTPDVIAWSGQQDLANGTTRSLPTRAGEVVTSEMVETKLIDREKEAEFVNKKLPEKNGNIAEDLDTDFLFYSGDEGISFDIYPVFSQTSTLNNLKVFYIKKGENTIFTQTVWENMNPYSLYETKKGPVEDSWVDDPNYWDGSGGYYETWKDYIYSKGVKITILPDYYFGFIWKGNYWPTDGTSNDAGVETLFYSSSELNPESYCTDGGGYKLNPEMTSKIHAVTFIHNNKTYLGFEDWTDFDFQDWIFTCDSELLQVKSSEILGEETTPPTLGSDDKYCDWSEECKNGQHPKHEKGHCEQCPEGQGCNAPSVEDTTPSTPSTPGTGYKHDNEVEVNYSINDVHKNGNEQKYEKADLWTKLSIHIRKGTDVKITIPLPNKYLCESDDLVILQNHENGMHTLPADQVNNTATYFITDQEKNRSWTVTLTVTFDENEITVITDGINQDLIDYLMGKNGDGINFEIWNYFQQDTVDLLSQNETTLKSILDQSTIEFLDDDPDYYINAFGWEDTVNKTGQREDDCTVKPATTEPYPSEPNYTGNHLNGTPYNDIYVKTGATPDHAHSGN